MMLFVGVGAVTGSLIVASLGSSADGVTTLCVQIAFGCSSRCSRSRASFT